MILLLKFIFIIQKQVESRECESHGSKIIHQCVTHHVALCFAKSKSCSKFQNFKQLKYHNIHKTELSYWE